VALNCGIGSSLLSTLVKAFDKLHRVLAEDFESCGSVQAVEGGQKASRSFQFAMHGCCPLWSDVLSIGGCRLLRGNG
jgi:hypothetical protein